MTLPKFLIADNSDFPENIYVIHTEFPRFILEVEEESVEWWDDVDAEGENVEDDLTQLVEEAFAFLEKEIETYDEDEEE